MTSLAKTPAAASQILQGLWACSGTGRGPANGFEIGESAPGLASSFPVSAAAQTSIAAAALAGAEFWSYRTGASQMIRVSRAAAERECTGYFTLNGQVPEAWAKYSGLYRCSDGHVRIHANFDHHRDGVLTLLGLPPGESVSREAVAGALQSWRAADFEDAAAQAGLVVAMARSFEAWDHHPHALAARQLPLLTIDRIDDAQPRIDEPISAIQAPLTGIRVLDLTRILAGPICGRTLAAYGADVMLINSPRLPNIESIADTSRGKRSAEIDLTEATGRGQLGRLIEAAHVFVQGYRPGGLAALGFSASDLARQRPGIVAVSLSAYGPTGPWADRRGFDSLVQTATGFNLAEAAAAGAAQPRALPVPILDYASGFLMAFGAQIALLRQRTEGGSWHVQVSLLQTANWLRSLGRVENGFEVQRPRLADHLLDYPCTHATLRAMPHAAEFSVTPAHWRLPSALPGTHPPVWSWPAT